MATKELDTAAMEKEKELRQKRIDTAVRFLQNPKVVETPLSRKKQFLLKKGLKEDEIEEALRLSGTPLDEHSSLPPSPARPLRSAVGPSVPPLPPPPVPWRSYMGAAILGGGIGYTLAHLFKAFVLPYFYHKKSKEEEKLEAIETSVNQLQENVKDSVQRSLDSVQELLEQQQSKLQSLALDLASTQSKVALLPSESYTIGDLKGEILSLKGLLLNRKQFPSPMVGSTPAAPPSIPAWQRTVHPTERSSTSPLIDSEPTSATELSNTNESSSGKATSLQYSSLNGESHHKPSSVHEDADEYVEIESEGTADNSQTEGTGSTSSSETDTANTPKTVVAASDRNLNDAMLNNSSVLSSDTSVSSMSDNTSFHDSSIAFSSTCIKTSASDTISPPEFTADSATEGANESAGV
ncbi:peroxisomal membrane protein PEX14-like [Acropora muricata]|uniref:peroxisomal membrane protein PEX14-like n=1 Tax=Acropora muricata TaxID=159855 RepID=UPI0034E4C773